MAFVTRVLNRICGRKLKWSVYAWRYSSTVFAGGNRGVEDGNGNELKAIDGCGRFVVRESYKGVGGGTS